MSNAFSRKAVSFPFALGRTLLRAELQDAGASCLVRLSLRFACCRMAVSAAGSLVAPSLLGCKLAYDNVYQFGRCYSPGS